MQTFFEHFHFLRPWLLLLILPLFFMLYRFKTSHGSLGNWKKVCDPALLAYLQVGQDTQSSFSSLWWMGIAGLLAITALAGPAWQQLPQPMYREQSALVIMLDLSRSMDATDIKPNRLTRAKQKITDILTLRQEGQTALVVFAGSSFVVTPLTADNQTIIAQLQGLSTDIMPLQGGNMDAAMDKAMLLLSQASIQHGKVLALTDSDDFSIAKVQQLTQAGHQLSVIGVGTTVGAPIAKASGGFLTDRQGSIVIAKLKMQALQRLAQLGHGMYQPLSLDSSDIESILRQSTRTRWDSTQKQSLQTSDQWQEEGSWLLLLLIPFVLVGFRRGVLVIMLGLVLQPQPAQALAWQDLWQTKHQQAQSMMQQHDYANAEKIFTDSTWKAAAAYKNKDYEAALQAFNAIDHPTPDDYYNKGNALAQLGRLDDAIAAYDAALKLQPEHHDAKSNKALLEKTKQAQQNQEQDNQKKEQQGDKSGDKPDKSAESEGDKQTQDQSAEQQDGNQNDGGESQPHQSEKGDQETSQAQHKEQEAKDKAEQAAAEQNKMQQEGTQEKQAQAQKLSPEDIAKSEVKQAFEQSLRRIPDDPAGLLRRKFKYQYQQQYRGQKNPDAEQW